MVETGKRRWSMKINGFKSYIKFKKVECPECGMFCAMELENGPKKGSIECASSDHIKPCNFFLDNTGGV